ncbi:MAG: DUF6049 family protein [Actinomycetia bacterium]|nr:DUF6049 family protein [Actinomycetes bacterium]
MTPTRRRPARGVWRWLGMLLATSAAAVLLIPGGGASAAPLTTELRLTTLSPISAQPGTTLRAKGTFTANRTLEDVAVRLEVGTTAFVSRSAITEAAANPPFTTAVSGADDDLNKVRRGTTEEFSIAVPTDDLPFDSPDVFPLRIVAVDAVTGAELSEIATFLPWAPDGVGVSPTRLLMFWPLVGEPTRDSTGEFVDDSLASAVAPGGRLSTLVRSGSGAPATWVVDPALLDDTAALDQPGAEQWLSSFSASADTREVVALPYGDPDVAAVASAGRPGFLRQGQAKGDRVYQRLVGTTARSDLSWPADGAGDEQVIGTSGRAGDTVVLLSEENAPLVSPLTYTPSGRIAWEDPQVDVLLADPPASALVASPADTATDVLLARQRFLAETLLHALELYEPRLLVIAPPRRWDPSPLWADELVTAIRRASWLNPVSLDQAVHPSAPTVLRDSPSIPTTTLDRQLPASMVAAASQALTDNHRLAAILTRPKQLSTPIGKSLFTSVSTAWRADPPAAEASQAATLDQLSSQRSKVRIVSAGGTLGGDSGSFPVTLRNQLDQAVVVRLGVTSTDPLRLRVNGPDERIKIAPARSFLAEVQLDATTSGRLSFDAQLLTPRGAAYDDPVTLAVDVKGFGQITFVVFGAAVALLILAAGIRVFRRIRAARRVAL